MAPWDFRHLGDNQHGRRDESAMADASGEPSGDGAPSGEPASIDAPSPAPAVSQAEAADMLNVSRPSVQRAREVQARGVPALSAAVDAGEVSVSAAVTHPFVARVRAELSENGYQIERTVERGGTIYTMQKGATRRQRGTVVA